MKCYSKPQQMTSVEKTAEIEEKVQLSYVVAEKIVLLTKVKFAPDYCQELVSKTFAKALHSFYSNEKLNLSIATYYPKDPHAESPNLTRLSIGGLSKRWKEEIRTNEENLDRAVEQIFSRFPQISLKLEGQNVGYIASVVCDALSKARNVTIESLYIFANYSNLIRCQELIEKLSENLRALELDFNWDMKSADESMSKKFWQTVSSCPKVTVSSHPPLLSFASARCNPPFSDPDRHLHLTDCLKLIKVKHFGINSQDQIDEIEWVLCTLTENENLGEPKFMCHDDGSYLGNFDTVNNEKVLLALSRSDSVKNKIVSVGLGVFWNFLPWRTILQALSDRALMKVSIVLLHEFGLEHSMLHVLQMYLELSHQTAKAIKLRLFLLGEDDVDDAILFNQALDRLSSTNEFHGLKLTPFGRWTRITFGNGNLLVKTRII